MEFFNCPSIQADNKGHPNHSRVKRTFLYTFSAFLSFIPNFLTRHLFSKNFSFLVLFECCVACDFKSFFAIGPGSGYSLSISTFHEALEQDDLNCVSTLHGVFWFDCYLVFLSRVLFTVSLQLDGHLPDFISNS